MHALTLQARLRPRKVAISDLTSGRSWTYSEWEEFIGKTAFWLREQGLKSGDRVVCVAKNCAELVAMHFATAEAGVLFVPLNWRLSKDEINTLIHDCKPALIVGDELAEGIGQAYFNLDKLSESVENGECLKLVGKHQDSPSLILYTSGTTGLPKGVLHSENTIMETTLNMALLGQVDEGSVFLCEAPMFHVIGLISCVRPALYQGGTLLISDGFIPERTLHRLADPQLEITHYFCVPQMANALRHEEAFDPGKLKSLKGILTGGAPHPAVQIRAWLNDGIPIVDGYGMSEAGTVFGMPFDLNILDEKAGFVGVATHRIQVRLMKGSSDVAGVNEAGEVQLKGPNLFIGLWNKDDAYAECFTVDGWFKTGDIALCDKDGFYRIVDRIKDMFISGGENVYPAEIEAVALSVDNVKECALIGVPDEKWGEVGCLFIVPKCSAEQFDMGHLNDKLEASLGRYKLPKKIKLMDALPRTGAGKVRKNILKQEYV